MGEYKSSAWSVQAQLSGTMSMVDAERAEHQARIESTAISFRLRNSLSSEADSTEYVR